MHGPKMTTKLLAEALRAKEHNLWGDKKVYRRVADNNNPLLLQDLASLHGISFAATTKDNLDAMVNELRLYVGAGRVIIHPRCKHLIGCLKFGVWEETRRQFARSASFGHFDGLAALIYLVRNLDAVTNPIPALHDLSEDTHYISDEVRESQKAKLLKEMLGLQRSLN
jgi:hypothetical protein